MISLEKSTNLSIIIDLGNWQKSTTIDFNYIQSRKIVYRSIRIDLWKSIIDLEKSIIDLSPPYNQSRKIDQNRNCSYKKSAQIEIIDFENQLSIIFDRFWLIFHNWLSRFFETTFYQFQIFIIFLSKNSINQLKLQSPKILIRVPTPKWEVPKSSDSSRVRNIVKKIMGFHASRTSINVGVANWCTFSHHRSVKAHSKMSAHHYLWTIIHVVLKKKTTWSPPRFETLLIARLNQISKKNKNNLIPAVKNFQLFSLCNLLDTYECVGPPRCSIRWLNVYF